MAKNQKKRYNILVGYDYPAGLCPDRRELRWFLKHMDGQEAIPLLNSLWLIQTERSPTQVYNELTNFLEIEPENHENVGLFVARISNRPRAIRAIGLKSEIPRL